MENSEDTSTEIKAEVIEEVEQEKIKEEISKKKQEERFEKQKTEWQNSTEKQQTVKKKTKKWLIPVVLILTIAIVLSTVFALINSRSEKIISGVTIDKLNMQGLTKAEAKDFLSKKIEEKLNKEMEIDIDNEKNHIILSQIELKYMVDPVIEDAYLIGRDSNIFVNNFNIIKSMLLGEKLYIGYEINEELLNSKVEEICNNIPNAVKQVSYYVEGSELIITRGTKGLTINKEKLKDAIRNNITLGNDEVISLNAFEIEPEDINIEKIHEDVFKEPQDAYYTTDPFQIYPEVIGVDFNIDEAKKVLEEYKEEYTISLTLTNPNKTINEIGTEAFPDLISRFTTRYDESLVSRSTNVKLATKKINGTVVMPGETFSYNKTVGKRTVEAGYKDAAGYEGGKVVQMIGGGICQVSSTLYDAAVLANMQIVERHNHAFLTSYVGAGKDATVVYGALDFKFKNTRKYPIKINATASNGLLKIEIYGIKEENEYEIDIQTTILNYIGFKTIYEDNASLDAGYEKTTQNGMNGCRSITYKIFKQNGKEVSREVLSSDTYDPMNKYVTRGTKNVAPAITEPTIPEEPTNPDTPQEPETPEEPSTPETPQNTVEGEDEPIEP